MNKNLSKKIQKGLVCLSTLLSACIQQGGAMEARPTLQISSCLSRAFIADLKNEVDKVTDIKKQLKNTQKFFAKMAAIVGDGTLDPFSHHSLLNARAILRTFAIPEEEKFLFTETIIQLADAIDSLYKEALAIEGLEDSVCEIREYDSTWKPTAEKAIPRKLFQRLDLHAKQVKHLHTTFLNPLRIAHLHDSLEKFENLKDWMQRWQECYALYQDTVEKASLQRPTVEQLEGSMLVSGLSNVEIRAILAYLKPEDRMALACANHAFYKKFRPFTPAGAKDALERLIAVAASIVKPIASFETVATLQVGDEEEWCQMLSSAFPSLEAVGQGLFKIFVHTVSPLTMLQCIHTFPSIYKLFQLDTMQAPMVIPFSSNFFLKKSDYDLHTEMLANPFLWMPRNAMGIPKESFELKTALLGFGYNLLERKQLFEELKVVIFLMTHSTFLQKPLKKILEDTAWSFQQLYTSTHNIGLHYRDYKEIYCEHPPLVTILSALAYFENPLQDKHVLSNRYRWMLSNEYPDNAPKVSSYTIEWVKASENTLYQGESLETILKKIS